jgi:hypothetical protein
MSDEPSLNANEVSFKIFQISSGLNESSFDIFLTPSGTNGVLFIVVKPCSPEGSSNPRQILSSARLKIRQLGDDSLPTLHSNGGC